MRTYKLSETTLVKIGELLVDVENCDEYSSHDDVEEVIELLKKDYDTYNYGDVIDWNGQKVYSIQSEETFTNSIGLTFTFPCPVSFDTAKTNISEVLGSHIIIDNTFYKIKSIETFAKGGIYGKGLGIGVTVV